MHTDNTVSANDILIFEKVGVGVRKMYGHYSATGCFIALSVVYTWHGL